jgi:hypothetical protein
LPTPAGTQRWENLKIVAKWSKQIFVNGGDFVRDRSGSEAARTAAVGHPVGKPRREGPGVQIQVAQWQHESSTSTKFFGGGTSGSGSGAASGFG